MDRRVFIERIGLAAAAAAGGGVAACDGTGAPDPGTLPGDEGWEAVRRRMPIDRDYIHLAGMLIAPHPAPVAEDVERYRTSLDANPALHVEDNNAGREAAARRAAAAYLGAEASDVALMESTTMGIALVYNGIALRPDQEMLTTTHDYYSTHEALRYRARRTGATLRMVEPFASSRAATADEITDRIVGAIGPRTRVLALTWVHSWTGTMIPVRRIADGLGDLNANRDPDDRVLLCLDGVHGMGVEDVDLPGLGCDFFMAGAHKWLLGPRGTGILWGRPQTQDAVTPTIPTFSDESGWGGRMTPGGFKAFEHTWALAAAFDFHRELGRGRIAERIHALTRQALEGLAAIDGVVVHTPTEPGLSAGITSFDIEGMNAQSVVNRLEERRIVASVAPYPEPHVRFSPGLLNSTAEIDMALDAVHAIA